MKLGEGSFVNKAIVAGFVLFVVQDNFMYKQSLILCINKGCELFFMLGFGVLVQSWKHMKRQGSLIQRKRCWLQASKN